MTNSARGPLDGVKRGDIVAYGDASFGYPITVTAVRGEFVHAGGMKFYRLTGAHAERRDTPISNDPVRVAAAVKRDLYNTARGYFRHMPSTPNPTQQHGIAARRACDAMEAALREKGEWE